MKSLRTIHFISLVALVAYCLSANGRLLLGGCPDEEPYECNCPNGPSTTVDCTKLGKNACSGKGQKIAANDFCCSYVQGSQCLTSTTEALCYTEYNCTWDMNANACIFDPSSAVPHNATTMMRSGCNT